MFYFTVKETIMTEFLTDTLLMIKPVHFRGNDQTAVNNYYQSKQSITSEEAQHKALVEFEKFVDKLRENDIEVIVMLDNEEHDTPDSVFPNNWISFHEDGTVAIYPMFAENRRHERRDDLIDYLELQGLSVGDKIDFTGWESQNKFLEGTGSLVLDRENKIAYAALSERTDEEVLEDFKSKMGYEVVAFHSNQTANGKRVPVYHTNVMMAMGDTFCIACMDSIDDEAEKNELILSLTTSGKEIVEISEGQMGRFAGNALQLKNKKGKTVLVMSESAAKSLDNDQLEDLQKYNDLIISSPLDTIESLGGGSARCMMAEVFLPRV